MSEQSPPPELPDLDIDRLEALAKAMLNAPTTIKAEVAQQEFHEAASPAAVLALIALARRAQPEGEAPQAEQWREYVGKLRSTLYGIAKTFDDHELRQRAQEAYDLAAPAAQHAESGAQAAFQPHSWTGSPITMVSLIESLCTYARCMPTAGRAQWAMAEAAKALAAQPQGAQAADLDAGIAAIGEMCRSIADDEDPQYIVLQSAMKKLRNLKRAQQAAAPGALELLNAEELAALHRFQETCEDSEGYDVGKDMMKRLAAIGVIESKGFNRYQFTEFGDYVVENRAPSAPGTPEAPKGGA